MIEKRFYERDSTIKNGLKVIIDKDKQYTFPPLPKESNHMFLKALNDAYETLETLKLYDKEDWIEVENINTIYREFGFDGVIKYAKDKLQPYGVVREEEPGLYVMATGGWSDHENWINCLNNLISLFSMKHYRANTRGGAFYYTKEPYKDVEIKIKEVKII